MNDEIDILPRLLKEVKDKFELSYGESEIVEKAFLKLKAKKATYKTANEFAIEIGEILSEALSTSLTVDVLPDGKMYYNIAKRLLEDVLGQNYEIVSSYTAGVQKELNTKAKIGLAIQIPSLNKDRIDGLVNRLSSEESFDTIAWLVDEPIVNFTQSIVDDFIQSNAEFHYKAGLKPEIIRHALSDCCAWCRSIEGTYSYPKVPKNVYARHNRCRCTTEYDPKSGKKQDVWKKTWR